MPNFSKLLLRALCKLFEGLERVITAAFYTRFRHRSEILLRMQTIQQLSSYNKLRKGLAPAKAVRPRIVVIVPFRDKWDLTQNCLRGVLSQQYRGEIKLIMVDNGSQETATIDGVQELLAEDSRVSLLPLPGPFNFSKLMNEAASRFGGKDDYLFFLNNDIDLVSRKALVSFVDFIASHDEVGAVGCTLLYENGCIQHTFVSPGTKIAGAHPLKGSPYRPEDPWFHSPRPVPAVTGAAMMVRFEEFQGIGGFDEALAVGCQDLDLCLRLQAKGLINWTLTQTVMIHHESLTRTCTLPAEDIKRFYRKWGAALYHNPFWNERFSTWSETPSIRILPFRYPWRAMLPKKRALSDT